MHANYDFQQFKLQKQKERIISLYITSANIDSMEYLLNSLGLAFSLIYQWLSLAQ